MNTLKPLQLTALSSALALALLAPTASAQLSAAGTTSSGSFSFTQPADTTQERTTAGEWPGALRILSYHPDIRVPRKIYTASCRVPGGNMRIFTSLTTRVGPKQGATPTESGTYSGMILAGDVTSAGTVNNFTQRTFSECKDMAGIVTDSTCSTVAALCVRASSATGATADLVANLPGTTSDGGWKDWLTADTFDNHMWLYEWKGTSTAPVANPTGAAPGKTYVISKAIFANANPADVEGGKRTASYSLAMNATHYAASLRSVTGWGLTSTGAKRKHDGDSLIVINRASPAIDTTRGWVWGCGTGHTQSNRVTLGTLGVFAALCSTDSNGGTNTDGRAGVWMHIEGKTASRILELYRGHSTDGAGATLKVNGGSTSLVPKSDGGYIAAIVGTADPSSASASRIGLVHYSKDGVAGAVKWVKTDANYYLAYPQLVSLGQDSAGVERYVLGWGQMMKSTTSFLSPTPGGTQHLASKYFVQEIDMNGNLKSQQLQITHGWGEQDQMLSLGGGRVGWVYRPDATIKLSADGNSVTSMPSPHSPSLIWMTYTSTSW